MWLCVFYDVAGADVGCRLLEFAANYFDLSSFPDGETKRALQRAVNKRSGKAQRINGEEERPKKKLTKVKT